MNQKTRRPELIPPPYGVRQLDALPKLTPSLQLALAFTHDPVYTRAGAV